MVYIGFDLGDGESSLAYYDSDRKYINDEPETLLVDGKKSFPTAVATVEGSGDVVIGGNAISGNCNARDLRVCFKRNFKSCDGDVFNSYRNFIHALLAKLREKSLPFNLDNPEEYRFVVGYPADWKDETIESYRNLLESCGIHNPYMTSESRAALVYFRTCRSVDFPMLNSRDSVLICDLGSSTLDFAYMPDGNIDNVKIFGHPNVGGGYIDRLIVMENIDRMENKEALARLFDCDKDFRSVLMYEARKLKEKYFSFGDEVSKEVVVFRKEADSVKLIVNERIIKASISRPLSECGNQSVEYMLGSMIEEAVNHTEKKPPRLVIITGGASKMEFFRQMCQTAFSHQGAEIVFSQSPETDIANGLALDGNYISKLGGLKCDISAYLSGETIDSLVSGRIDNLYERLASALVEDLVRQDDVSPGVLRTSFASWISDGGSLSINDLSDGFTNALNAYKSSPRFDEVMSVNTEKWLEETIDSVQEDIDRLCRKHGVNSAVAELKHSIKGNDVRLSDIRMDAGDEFKETVAVICGVVMTVAIASLCGGSGMALVASGPVGMLVGGVVAAVASFVFKGQTRKAVSAIKINHLFRKAFVKESSVFSQGQTDRMKKNCAKAFGENDGLRADIRDRISNYIRQIVHELEIQTKV